MPRRKKSLLGTIVDLALALVVVSALFSVVAQQLLGKSWGWSVVQGRSMEPTMAYGDLVFVFPFTSSIHQVQVGDIIVYERMSPMGRTEFVMHRVVDWSVNGYMTKGDALSFIDQEAGYKPVELREIHGVVPTLGNFAILIPKLGLLVMYASRFDRVHVMLALVAVTGLTTAYDYFRRPPYRRRNRAERRKSFYQRYAFSLSYVGLALALTLILASGMALAVQRGNAVYEISERGAGIIAGSGGLNFGVLRVGDSKSMSVNVSNGFVLPTVTVFLHESNDLSFSPNPVVMQPHQTEEVTVTLYANRESVGYHKPSITVLAFPMFLPADLIYTLAGYNQILAMLAVSLVPVLAALTPASIADYLHSRGRVRRSLGNRRARIQYRRRLRSIKYRLLGWWR